MTRVAFIDRDPRSGFLEADLRALERRFEVVRIRYPGSVTAGYVARCLVAALRCKAVYVFFASEHSLPPAILFRLLGRRVVLVQGGYDYANLPERGYGLAARGRAWLPKLIGRLCTTSLAISEQSRWEFLDLVPSAAPRTHLCHLSVAPELWRDPLVARNPDRVVTFGYIDSEAYERKGIDRFVAASAADPDREYVLAGRVAPGVAERISGVAPPNLRLTGHLDHDELRRLLWSSGVYAQLSWHETFGMAMAEAMLCGCVPVIGDSAALAEVAAAWAVRAADHESDAKAVAEAASLATRATREVMRSDVSRRFPAGPRADALARFMVGGR